MTTQFLSAIPSMSARRTTVGPHMVWAQLRLMIEARRTRRLLAEMEPRLLADIGTSPGDARMEAARPFWDVAARAAGGR